MHSARTAPKDRGTRSIIQGEETNENSCILYSRRGRNATATRPQRDCNAAATRRSADRVRRFSGSLCVCSDSVARRDAWEDGRPIQGCARQGAFCLLVLVYSGAAYGRMRRWRVAAWSWRAGGYESTHGGWAELAGGSMEQAPGALSTHCTVGTAVTPPSVHVPHERGHCVSITLQTTHAMVCRWPGDNFIQSVHADRRLSFDAHSRGAAWRPGALRGAGSDACANRCEALVPERPSGGWRMDWTAGRRRVRAKSGRGSMRAAE